MTMIFKVNIALQLFTNLNAILKCIFIKFLACFN